MTTILIPYPVSANRYWRHWGNRVVISTEAREYREEVAEIARAGGLLPIDGPVAIDLILHPYLPKDWQRRQRKNPDRWEYEVRRLDLGNCEKVVCDALQGVAFDDDRQITYLSVSLGSPIEGGGLTVCVESDYNRKYQ